MSDPHAGLVEALRYPFFSAVFQRRSRRISKGIQSVPAGRLTYTSTQAHQALSPLEEALLIAATGITGMTMPDLPLDTTDGQPLAGSPMIELAGRAASSPDNAQGTHFFLINDSGTFLLRRPSDPAPAPLGDALDADALVAQAEQCKVRVLDRRLDFPREYPFYLGRNRFVSNLPGSTILVPVVDLTRQYINGLMFLLSQPDGYRPTFIDDWNFYRTAGVERWVRNGFLNKNLKMPLGLAGTFRIQVEAELLIQNLLLAIQAMGLGGWVHAAFPAQILLGSPEAPKGSGPGLKFRFHTPKRTLWRTLRKFITPMPAWEANPVGLDGLLEGFCPPYHRSVGDAVDALVALKYGPKGLYTDPAHLESVFRPGLAETFVQEVHHYSPEIIACVKDVCQYIYDTYDRFPAHVDAMYVPGVWVQAHHVDLDYYDKLFRHGCSETQQRHQELWHPTVRT